MRKPLLLCTVVLPPILLLCACRTTTSRPPPAASIRSLNSIFHAEKLAEMDAAIERAIAEHDCPGAVLWMERNDAAYHRAYGKRALTPAEEPMSEDTIFDAASLTKVAVPESAGASDSEPSARGCSETVAPPGIGQAGAVWCSRRSKSSRLPPSWYGSSLRS